MAEPKKDTEIEQALTRSEVLRARGYPDEVVDAQHSTNGTTPAKVRSCPVCGGPVPEDRKTTCSSNCAVRFKGRDRPRAEPALAKAQIPAGIPLPSAPPAGLASAAAALVASLDGLAGMQRVTIELAGQVVTVTRAGTVIGRE